MSVADLRKKAVKLLLDSKFDSKEMQEGLRLARVAALKHNDATSAFYLFRAYTWLAKPGLAAWFLLRRAQMDDFDPMTNAKVGELHEGGSELFTLSFGAALYYHQRAARSGSTGSMMALANMFRRGRTSGKECVADHRRCTWTRSEEHTSELQSRVDISYAVFCLKKFISRRHTGITKVCKQDS